MTDYQSREDIDKLLKIIEELKYFIGYDEGKILASNDDLKNTIDDVISKIESEHYNKDNIDSLNDELSDDINSVDLKVESLKSAFGLDQEASIKFNYAIIHKTEGNLEYTEFWILANAYYDYNVERFIKINPESNSFGIQIQAEGSYPNEAELGYADNTSIGIWRNTKHSYVYKDTTHYDYTDFDEKNYIGAKQLSDDTWVEYGISAGWNNNFMLDSFGGMTVGGAGFEIDGNGIFPYTRVTSSVYSINGVSYYLLGLLDNAYHPTFGNDAVWGCDDNSTYSWFVGLKIPETSYLRKNNNGAKFVVMYNDTTADPDNPHDLDKTQWHVILEADTSNVKGIVNGTLTALENYTHPSTKQCNYAYTHPQTKQCNYSEDLSNYIQKSETEGFIKNDGTVGTPSAPEVDLSNYIQKSNTSGFIKNDGSVGQANNYIHPQNQQCNYSPDLSGYAPKDHKSGNTTYGVSDASNYGHAKASNTTPSSDTTNGDKGTVNGVFANADHSHPFSSIYAESGHGHTTDEIRLTGTQYAITTMLNTMYSWYQQQSSSSPSWSGDSQNHVYVRDITWNSTRNEYQITDSITDSISKGSILILNVASTSSHHYGGHDLTSFYNNGVSMNVVSNADMELADYSTVMLIYGGGGSSNSPMWIPILIDMRLCLTVDSSLVI